jgi:hypothetical protein
MTSETNSKQQVSEARKERKGHGKQTLLRWDDGQEPSDAERGSEKGHQGHHGGSGAHCCLLEPPVFEFGLSPSLSPVAANSCPLPG